MTYLYGDCGPSPLAVNYLATLRAAITMAIEILLAEDRLLTLGRRRRALAARIAGLEARLEGFRATVRQAVSAVAASPEDDPVTRCANQVESAVDAAVARAHGEITAQDQAAAAEITARERDAHGACVEAIGTFAAEHALPDEAREMEVELDATGAYAALARVTTPSGIAFELDVGLAATPFASGEVRAAAIADVRGAELKLDKLIVVGFRAGAGERVLTLRASRDRGADGYDVTLTSGGVELVRVRRGTAEVIAASAGDATALGILADRIEAIAGGTRGRLRAVLIDHAPLEEIDRPSIFVDRVFAAMAPIVRPIVERSITPGELRLLRELGDGRREEIFLPHAAIADLVGQVPFARRRHFDVLALPGLPAAPPPSTPTAAPDLSDPSIAIGYDD